MNSQIFRFCRAILSFSFCFPISCKDNGSSASHMAGGNLVGANGPMADATLNLVSIDASNSESASVDEGLKVDAKCRLLFLKSGFSTVSSGYQVREHFSFEPAKE